MAAALMRCLVTARVKPGQDNALARVITEPRACSDGDCTARLDAHPAVKGRPCRPSK
jgi:hypothetical protein